MPAAAIGVADLHDRVTVQTPTAVDDGQGGTTVTWVTNPTVMWASVVPEGGDLERIANMALMASAAYRVTVRYNPELSPVQRLLWTPYRASTTKTLQIHSVVMTPDRKWSVMRCSEVQG